MSRAPLPADGLDYYPLIQGYLLRYQHTSTEFDGTETVEIVLTEVLTREKLTTATAVLSRRGGGRAGTETFRIRRTAGKLFSEGGVLGLARLEFPVPPRPGARWTMPPDLHEVAALDCVIEVPAGKFRDCLRVNVLLAGGDGGSAIRYYAPGVGYVYEEYADENWGARIRLISYEKPANP